MSRREFLGATAILTACMVGGCAPMPLENRRDTGPLAFPKPPDDPRFYYERTIYGSADVVADEQASQFRRMITGEVRSGEGLAKPYAVAVHQGRIFLSDSVERFIKVFDVPRGRHFKIGDNDPGRLIKPLGIDVDRQGNLYVADATAKAILIYDRDGKYLRKIGGGAKDNWFDRLASVTADPKGDRIYVVDIGGVSSEAHRVRVFDPLSGKHLFDFGKRGTGPGEFNLPRDVAVGRDGQLYVVDGGNFRIQVFDRNGKYLQAFGRVGRQIGQFARPKEAATDKDGNLYVVDTAFGNIQIFNPEGDLLMFIGDRSEQDGPAKYMLPSGVYVDEDNRIYMVDQWFRKVDVFRPATLKVQEGFLGRMQIDKKIAK